MKRKLGSLVLGLAVVMAGSVRAAPSLSEIEVGNVTTTGFCLCWETSEPSNPGLEVFSDAAGTQSLAGQVAVEFFPLGSDQRSVASTVASRADGRALRDLMRAKNVVLVKVSGLDPGADYFARPTAVGQNGATIASGELQAVTTAQTVRFVNEARRVLVDLSSIDGPGTEVEGGLLVISTAEARYPLISVIGDGAGPTVGYADLTQFLTAAGDTNLLPAGVLALDIVWKGIADLPGVFADNQIGYGTEPVVAETSAVSFEPVTGEDVNYAVTFQRVPPVVGLPQDILVAAEDDQGTLVTTYNRPALIESTATLLAGGGATASFQGGILGAHRVIFGDAGQFTFTVRDPVGTSATTVPFEVLPLTYENWRAFYFGDLLDPDGDPEADPDGDGLRNAGEFTTLRHPLRRDGDVLNVVMTPGGLRAWLDFNRFQAEYVVAFDVSTNLQIWVRSDVDPSLQETLPERDLIEALFPPSEFGGAPFGAVRAVFESAP